MINMGIIGCGHWGPNHIRNFSHLPNSRALMCADLDDKRLKVMKATFLNIIPTDNYFDILTNKEIHAVCVCTPPSTHFKIVKEALLHDKDVLCEKPLTVSVGEGEELVALAKQKGRILMVGHVFLFNAGIRKLKDYINKGEIGTVQYAHSERTSLGPFRYDVSAIWELASHDIAIFNYLFTGVPSEVSARGHKCLTAERDDLAFISLQYPKNVLVNVHASWIDPKKVRSITIVGDKKMVYWDDLSSTGPIQLYDKHVEQNMRYYETFGEFQLLSKEGDITIPKIDLWEPLKAQDAYFIECVEQRKNPDIADGIKGLEVVKTLVAIQDSVEKRGAPVAVQDGRTL